VEVVAGQRQQHRETWRASVVQTLQSCLSSGQGFSSAESILSSYAISSDAIASSRISRGCHPREHYSFAGSADGFLAGISLRSTTHAAAAKRTSSFPSSKAVIIPETSERSPSVRLPPVQLPEPPNSCPWVAFSRAFAVPGFGSCAQLFCRLQPVPAKNRLSSPF